MVAALTILAGHLRDSDRLSAPEALAGLKLAYIIVPITGTLIAMAIMSRYDITEEKSHEMRLELEARRGARTIS